MTHHLHLVIHLPPHLADRVTEHARRAGTTPEALAIAALEKELPADPPASAAPVSPFVPRDDWERKLASAAVDAGVSLPDEAFDREHVDD